ncbi:hypothetical protein HDU76_003782 [Blyttiomyces sp. JEL0837]|nr:hypothetical protein HDU76_003782 [Blyttiomyces sp. JEL0837]
MTNPLPEVERIQIPLKGGDEDDNANIDSNNNDDNNNNDTNNDLPIPRPRQKPPHMRHLKRRTSLAGAPGMLRTDGPWWTDPTGRTLMLRGCNVSGSAKLPSSPYMPSHISDGFFNDTDVSFVGRPFPLEECDEHFARMRRWGLNFLRFNVAWEALEHEGPGIYDFEYMDYVVKVLLKAKQYGFRVFIDPHQDVWSRFSGGSGAPGWTLRMAGLDITQFNVTHAAIVHNTYHDPANYPKMIWPTNYFKLACATMFTLFFGGKTFAPNCLASDNKTNIQDYLQDHYCNAFIQLALRIQNAGGLEDDVVIGYDTLNEPSNGWIGNTDLKVISKDQDLKLGETPTPFQTMLLGMGFPCDVEKWELTWAGPAKKAVVRIDPNGESTWLPSSDNPLKRRQCVWAQHGVWDPKTLRLLKPDYFAKDPVTNKPIEFLSDFWRPFVHRFTRSIRTIHQTAVIFIEPPVNEHPPHWDANNGDPTWRIAYAPHWYDGMTLINKHFNPWFSVDFIGFKRGKYTAVPFALKFGEAGIRKCFKDQIVMLRWDGFEYLGQNPCIMGEIGIPYDMDNRHAYHSGDYTAQEKAMDTNMRALESNLINFTLWNYVSDNCNEWGDGWNGEDLSIFSRVTNGPGGSVVGGVVPDVVVSGGGNGDDGENGNGNGGENLQMGFISSGSTLNVGRNGGNGGDWKVVPEMNGNGGRDDLSASSTSPLVVDKDRTRKLSTETSLGSEESDSKVPDVASGSVGSNGVNGAPPLVPSGETGDDELRHLDIGGRALMAITRPYPVLTPGTPLNLTFDMESSLFSYSFCHPAVTTNLNSFGELHESPTSATNLGNQIPSTPTTESLYTMFHLPKHFPRPRRFSMFGSTGYHNPESSHSLLSPDRLATEVEIYIPRVHYPKLEEIEAWVSDGNVRIELEDQRLHWRCGCFDRDGNAGDGDGHGHETGANEDGRKVKMVEHTIVVRRRKHGQVPLMDVGLRRRREIRAERDEEVGRTMLERVGDGRMSVCPPCSIM